jgi:hypothetical protein
VTGARRLAVFVGGLVATAGILEVACRHWQPLLRAVSHRSLFKAALLERRLPQEVVFFGTSRSGEALRPGPFADELVRQGAPALSTFNVSTPYSSLDILEVVATRFAQAPRLRLALVEISEPQLHRNPLPWEEEPPGADLDARAFAWLTRHSALVAERKAFVLNSLGRLGIVELIGPRCDGTEETGGDYLSVALGRKRDVEPSGFLAADCPAEDVPPARATPMPEWAGAPEVYERIARAFAERGVPAVFYVPPFREPAAAVENGPAYRALYGEIAARTGRPVWNYGGCHLPPEYFRDPTHLDARGGSHFSRGVARDVMASHALP